MTGWPRTHRATEVNALAQKIIGCAIEVHRVLGPGLLESIYESAICLEFGEQHIEYERQRKLAATYKGHVLGQYRIDLIVENLVIVEVKAVERTQLLFEAQLLNYLRLTGLRVGLILNFNSHLLKDGITRMIL